MNAYINLAYCTVTIFTVSKPVHDFLTDAYNLSTPEDSRDFYGRWADTYDKVFIEQYQYVFPSKVATVIAKHIPSQGRFTIIDLGCGTGELGLHIAQLCPNTEIEGVDITPEMLKLASSKLRNDGTSVYTDLHEADLSDTIYFAANHFDFLVSAGTFTLGHLGAYELLDSLCVCRKGATIIVGVNEQHWIEQDFEALIAESVKSGTITKPRYELVDIYTQGSTHHASKGRVVIFKKN